MFDDFYNIPNLDSDEVVQQIWEKGIVVEGYNKDLYRKDFAGAWIARDAYGDTDRAFGWQIDHVYPKELGGQNHFVNLRPMHWRNNVSKDVDYPQYTAVVTSEENKNIMKNTACEVNDSLKEKLKDLYDIKC